MNPAPSSRMAPAMTAASGGLGDKIRGAMAVGQTGWGMVAPGQWRDYLAGNRRVASPATEWAITI